MHPILRILRERRLNPKGELPADLVFGGATEVSSRCAPGFLFVAVKGAKADGHAYLADAASRGATAALVCDPAVAAPPGMSLILVDDTRRAAGPVAQWIAGEPTLRTDVYGVTGTNGKTTTVFLMEKILEAAGQRPGIIGTVLTRWPGVELPAGETTPSAPALAQVMARMVGDGVNAIAFEVSSHAIDQGRVDGIRFRACALTNVTQDHLDYHKTMEEYAAVKLSLFDKMLAENPEAVGVVNLDDPTGRVLAERLPARNRITFAIEDERADLRATDVLMDDGGIRFHMNYRGRVQPIASPIHARFNVMNTLTAAGLALAGGVELEAIARGCAGFGGAPGRFEVVAGPPGVKVVVDYAHTPDALDKLLRNARSLTAGRLIAVFGCGGDRDNAKRPLMAAAANELADELVITNDNPRTEDEKRIVGHMLAGLPAEGGKPRRVIHNRREAIEEALRGACPGDTVVIAGKGHEDYQIIGIEKHHFDDREVAREIGAALRAETGGAASGGEGAR